MTRLEQLIQSNNFTELDGYRYRCPCGSTIKRSSVRGHLNTKKHKKYLETKDAGEEHDTGHDCHICYSKKKHFVSCKRCKNSICTVCCQRVKKCPFCRTKNSYTDLRQLRRRYSALIDVEVNKLYEKVFGSSPDMWSRNVDTVIRGLRNLQLSIEN
jgi:hypothetical protein